MGFRISWLAVRGKPPEQFRSELNLSVGGSIEGDFFFDQDFAGAQLYRGWYGVFMNDDVPECLADKSLSDLSHGAELIACRVNETVMDCSSQFWRGGDRIWFVRHDAQDSIDHLEVLGEPDGARIRRLTTQASMRTRAETDPPDYMFEVPVLMAFLETGFKHDRGYRKSPSFQELARHFAAKRDHADKVIKTKPIWKFW